MFQFKHFTIEDAESAMKIGTDGVLLGAWADVAGCSDILDVGTGTGLIAIMAAQRNVEAHIEAIDIVEEAAAEARANVARCPWAERIVVHSGDVKAFGGAKRYDHILSNPPFFTEAMHSPNAERSVARHATTLTYSDLVAVAEQLLKPEGRLSVVLPYDGAMQFRRAAFEHLWLTRLTNVVTVEGERPKRVLMEFRRSTKPLMPRCDELVIQHRGGHYSSHYMALTRDFYLIF